MKATHGGPGRGQGRKPLDENQRTETYTLKMPADLRDKAQRLGAERVRELIAAASEYRATYWHATGDTPGMLALEATDDAEAIAELKNLVGQGYRNQTGARAELSGARLYICQNVNGRAVGQYI